MPYNRGYKPYRKRYRRRRKYYKKPARYQYADMAYKGYKMGLKAMKFLNTEHKFHDTSANLNPDNSGFLLSLNLIAQGDTDVTRDGDSIKMMSMTYNACGSAAVDSTLRVIVFYDKQNSITTVSQFLDPSYVNTVNAVNSPKNHDTRFKTKTLLDFKLPLSVGGRNQYSFKKRIKLLLHTQFSGGSTTIETGALKMILISDVVSLQAPTINYVTRVSYIDN